MCNGNIELKNTLVDKIMSENLISEKQGEIHDIYQSKK